MYFSSVKPILFNITANMYFLLLLSIFLGSVALHTTYSAIDDEGIYNTADIHVYFMPEACKYDNFCFEKGHNYPDKEIADLLKNISDLPKTDANSVFDLCFGNKEHDNPDCPTNSTFNNKPIYYIVDKEGVVRVVVQTPKLQQIYSVKWCEHPGRITESKNFIKSSKTLEKYHAECVNSYMDFSFFVLGPDNLGIDVAAARDGIPVCCRCRYSEITNTDDK